MPRAIFSFGFAPSDLAPMLAMQNLMRDDTVLRNFMDQSLMSETLQKRLKNEEQASVMAQAVAEKSGKTKTSTKDSKEKETSSSYTISYYNPELKKAEVLEAQSEIKIQDIATKTIEETLAAQSVYSLYKYIGMPLIRTEVLPWKLEEILSQREYGTPPPPPSGASVAPVKVIALKESEIVALKKKEEEIKSAIEEAIVRKEESELKVEEELLVLEETVEALRKGEEIDKVIERLPPLSRARYMLVLRKKQLGRQAIIALLLRDAGFLKSVRKKLELFTLDDLVNMFKILRQLQKR
ncbi:MAG TPA: hypothetical protein VLD37_07080 [Candidatus Bilamarchaeum sp.]|nr:hypothetical protein [Candidatus Bilamarchaeum sp.]